MGDIKITVKVKGKEKVKRALEKAEKALEDDEFGESLGKGAEVMEKTLKQTAPKKTGALSASVSTEKRGQLEYRVAPDTVYAHIQDQGGTIHGNPWLVFEGRGGETVFARHVTLRGQGYMEKAFREGEQKAVDAVAEDLFKKMFG